MRFFNMIRKLFSVNKEVKAATERLETTQEIRKDLVAPIRKKIEERRRNSIPIAEPLTNGNGGSHA